MVDSVQVFPPGFRVTDTDGAPISGAKIRFYDAGTTTAKDVFSDSGLSVSLGSIVYCDGFGYPVTAQGGSTKTLVYTDTNAYKVTLQTSEGVTIANHDNVKGAVIGGGGGGGSGITQSAADARYIRNPNALSADSTTVAADLHPFWNVGAAANRAITSTNLIAALLGLASAAGYSSFPSGTRLLFQQTTPPTGWTKETASAYNDVALKFTTGTVGTGGSTAFSSIFASRTPSGTVGNTTLTLSQIAAHEHSLNKRDYATTGSSDGTRVSEGSTAGATDGSINTSTVGGGTSHTHSFTGDAMDFAVKYAEVCIGSKA
jgi:hypothetical protein